MEDYRTLLGQGTGEYEEKHSRFIGLAQFADTEEKALAVLNGVRAANRTARHNVYAYVLREGNRTRYSDDGEPAKTAGLPVLEAIRHAGLTDCVVVVTRYFGGILLGAGGLVRAYTKGAKIAVDAAGKSMKRVWTVLYVPCPYSFYERVRLEVEGFGGIVRKADFGAEVELELLFPEAKTQEFLDRLTDMTAGTVESMEIGQEYRAFPVSGKGSDCVDG